MSPVGSPAGDAGPYGPDDHELTTAAAIRIRLEPTTALSPQAGRTIAVALEVTVRPALRRPRRRRGK